MHNQAMLGLWRGYAIGSHKVPGGKGMVVTKAGVVMED